MSKTSRYKEFQLYPHCYTYKYQDLDLDLGFDQAKKLVLELGCGSGKYALELAKLYPDVQFLWVDSKSDRLHFGAKRSTEQNIKNTKRLWASVDHILPCVPAQSVDEIWITFPDPRPGRDRQKLTSPKYQTIYKSLLKSGWIIHVKTDDKVFFYYSVEKLREWWFQIIQIIEDIYNQKDIELTPELKIKTFYEQQWLDMGRKVYYLKVKSFVE